MIKMKPMLEELKPHSFIGCFTLKDTHTPMRSCRFATTVKTYFSGDSIRTYNYSNEDFVILFFVAFSVCMHAQIRMYG